MKDLKLKAITALLLMTVLCALGNYLLVRRAILLSSEIRSQNTGWKRRA